MAEKVYIASPYTLGNTGDNVRKQHEAFDTLLSLGFIPFAPLLFHYQHICFPRSEAEWLRLDFEWLAVCDCILRLEGESKGADMEVDRAKKLGIPVYYDMEELINGKQS